MKLDIGKGTTQLITAKLDNGKVIIQMNRLFAPEEIGEHSPSKTNIVMDGCTLLIHNSKGLEQLEMTVSTARKYLEEDNKND